MEHHEKMLQRDRDIITLFRHTHKEPQQSTTNLIVACLIKITSLLATIVLPICAFLYVFRILSGG